jgi:hypothetical protein
MMKWPSLAAHSRASLAESAAQILHWAQQASLPVGCLSKPAVLRTALKALTFRLDGRRAAANTIIRKRVVLHGALGYAAEAGLLPDNPWTASPGTYRSRQQPSTPPSWPAPNKSARC